MKKSPLLITSLFMAISLSPISAIAGTDQSMLSKEDCMHFIDNQRDYSQKVMGENSGWRSILIGALAGSVSGLFVIKYRDRKATKKTNHPNDGNKK